jgi:hypothetical protein
MESTLVGASTTTYDLGSFQLTHTRIADHDTARLSATALS